MTQRRDLLRDRDGTYGEEFRQRVKGIGIAEVLTTPRSPWQNAFAERVIGTIRRELLDHVIVLNEQHPRRRLRSYFRYYHASRTHLALDKDSPDRRAVEPLDVDSSSLFRRSAASTTATSARRSTKSSQSSFVREASVIRPRPMNAGSRHQHLA